MTSFSSSSSGGDSESSSTNFDLFSNKPRRPVPPPDPPDLIEQYDVSEDGTCKFKRFWMRGRFLGRGGFSKVYVVHPEDDNDTTERYVGKFVYKYLDRPFDIAREVMLHSEMDHEHIVKCHEMFEAGDFFVIVMDRCAGNLQSLLKARNRLTEPEARYFLWQVMDALKYIHAQGVMFRDLKAGNVLLTEDLRVKLTDFGFAIRQNISREYCGTPNYVAPEVINCDYYTKRVDTWSLGVLAYNLLVGRCPFESESVRSTYQMIREQDVRFPARVAPELSEEAKDFIRVALNRNSQHRPTVLQMSGHPFLTSYIILRELPASVAVRRPIFELSITEKIPEKSTSIECRSDEESS